MMLNKTGLAIEAKSDHNERPKGESGGLSP